MSVFSSLYDRVRGWAAHPHAERYLAGLRFAESSFFPVPPDVMLAPMTLAQPNRGWRFAFLTTIASVTGGIAGYAIGWWALDAIEPLLRSLGYWDSYLRSTEWFETWGFLAVLAAGFTPIPYKVFTISAGFFDMPFLPFAIASVISRSLRFFIVAGLIGLLYEKYGNKIQEFIDKYFNWLVLTFAVLLIGGFMLLRLF